MKWDSAKTLAVIVAQSLALSYSSVANAQGSIASGQTQTGTISPAGDSDSWTFSANAGDSMVIRVGEITQANGFTPRIRLFSPGAALLATASGSTAAEIAVTAANSGTFTVVVDDAVGTVATGTYRLTLAKTGSAVEVLPGDEGGLLTNGLMNAGTIDVGDLDVWSVAASAGESIVLSMGEVNSGSPLGPAIRIYSPSGALLGNNSGSGAVGMTVTASISGSYMIVVGDDSSGGFDGSGPYRLTMAKTGSAVEVSPGDEGGLLTNGLMYTGTIDVGDLDVWSATAGAGESIVLSMGEVNSGSSLEPWVRIYGPSGALLGGSFASAATDVTVTVPTGGNILVVIGDASAGNGGSGPYRLTMGKTGSPVEVSPGDEGGVLTNGLMNTGTIEAGDLDVWSVTASAGESIVLSMGEVNSGSSLGPRIRIYSPSGALLGNNSGSGAVGMTVTAPISGSYMIVVGDDSSGGLDGSGPYRFTMAKTGSAVEVSPGDEGGLLTNGLITGIIDVGDLDVWLATVNSGNHVVIHMDEVTNGSSLEPWVRIYGPSGALLGGNFGSTAAVVAVTVPTSGNILVVAGDGSPSSGGSGPYLLTVSGILPPIAICRDSTNILTSGCTTNVPAAEADNGSFDPDGTIVSRTLSPAGPYGLGNTPVILRVVDDSGLTGTCDAVVTVLDLLRPTIACPADLTVPAAPGSCSSNVSFNVVASDNCGISNVVAIPASGSSFPIGTTLVNVTATDTSGNTTNCSFSVTVSDTQLPAIICPADLTVPAAPGSCSSNVSFNVVASDNCGISNVVAIPASGSSFPIGTTLVNVTVTDTSGNTTNCSFSVTVNDTQLPTVSCPANVITNVPEGVTSAVVTFPAATAGDNCPGVTTFCDPPSGTTFTLGANTVVCTAVDASGNSNTCSFLVQVLTLPPTYEPPVAGFTANPTKGAAPLAVSFADTSTGTTTNRVWDLGDGGASAASSVVHTYAAPGVYSITLSVFGPGGADTLSKSGLITVTNAAPKIVSPPTATNVLGQVGDTAVVRPGQATGFSVGSYDADGNPLSCFWDFGGGATSTECNPSYVFTNCGSRDVWVTIGDGFASVSTGMTVAVTCPMSISGLKLRAQFKRVGSDNCAIKGTLADLPAGFTIANAAVRLDVGGTTVDFQLNAKGQGVNGNGKIKFTYNKKTGVWTYKGKLKGDMKASWAKHGITSGISINANVTFPILLILQSDTLESFHAEPPLNYRNSSGASGTAKLLPPP